MTPRLLVMGITGFTVPDGRPACLEPLAFALQEEPAIDFRLHAWDHSWSAYQEIEAAVTRSGAARVALVTHSFGCSAGWRVAMALGALGRVVDYWEALDPVEVPTWDMGKFLTVPANVRAARVLLAEFCTFSTGGVVWHSPLRNPGPAYASAEYPVGHGDLLRVPEVLRQVLDDLRGLIKPDQS